MSNKIQKINSVFQEVFKKITENKTPAAIILASIILGASIISYAFINQNTVNNDTKKEKINEILNQDKYFTAREFKENEYLMGNKKSDITLVVYNDFECPFCGKFQRETVEKLLEKYKNENRFSIVYRHFAQSYHEKAIPEINASFCVRENYGQESYINFIIDIYNNTNGNDGLDLSTLPKIAENSVKASNKKTKDFNKEEFISCSNELKYKNLIDADYTDAIEAGLDGTPYSVLTFRDGDKNIIISKISGARDISYFEKIITELLKIK
jgi:hypothetical protein